MTLYIICGHGAGDPGATGGGYNEADLVRKLASRMLALGGSNVSVLNTNINWYASKAVNASLKNTVGSNPVIELHMDSAVASARGGHVIIKSGFDADSYDTALSKYISGKFPGRSNSIVKRSNLRNVNQAAANGINYRLLECCFISNDSDRTVFINEMDSVARGILACFGIGSSASTPSTPSTSNKTSSNKTSSNYNEWVARLQKECNAQGFSNQTVDGIAGPVTLAGCPTLKKGSRGNITKLLQERLNALGYNCGSADGINGNKTQAAIQSFQSYRGLTVDGIVGPLTWRKLLGL